MHMNVRCPVVLPVLVQSGERVITSHGGIAIVTHCVGPVVYGLGPCDRVPHAIVVRGDAWGGEHDQTYGLAA